MTRTRITRFDLPRSLTNDWDGNRHYQADFDLLGARVAKAIGWENRARHPMIKVGSGLAGDHRYITIREPVARDEWADEPAGVWCDEHQRTEDSEAHDLARVDAHEAADVDPFAGIVDVKHNDPWDAS